MQIRLAVFLNNTKTPNLTFLGCKIGCLFCNLLISSVYCGETGFRTLPLYFRIYQLISFHYFASCNEFVTT